jgi:hypothetical protein
VTASRRTIAYGDTVSIRWSGSHIDSLDVGASNIPVSENQIAASITDQPAGDTTYTVTSNGKDHEKHTRSVTVHVLPSSRKFWLIGDQALAGMPQIAAAYQQFTSVPVVKQLAWPGAASTDDLVVVFESALIGPSDQEAVERFLSAGGRVVFAGRSLSKLASGDVEGESISTIGSWAFGAERQLGDGFGTPFTHVVESNPGIPLSVVTYGKGVSSTGAVTPIASSAHRLTELVADGSAFATYDPPTGGHIGILGMVSAGSTGEDLLHTHLAAAVIRQVADGH